MSTAANAIDERLRSELTERTYAHSLAVAERVAELASTFGIDVTAGRLAGLLHDCAKDVAADDYLSLAEEAGIEILDAERAQPTVLHQRLGAAWAEARYGVTDREVLAAIGCHTTGRAEMGSLARCLMVADYTSADRSFGGLAPLREAAAEGEWEGFRAVLRAKQVLVARRGLPEHPWATEAYSRWL